MKLRVLLTLLLLTLARAGAQSVVVNDTFADGERATQNPPGSLAWYHNTTTPANLAVRNGALDVVVANDVRTVWAYFPAVALNVGDSLTLSLDFSVTANADSGFRLALGYTNGVPPQLSDVRAGPTGNYLGYHINRTSIFKRDGPFASAPTSSLLDSLGSGATAIWLTRANNPALGGPTAANTPYTAVLKITRTGSDTALVTSNYSGAGLSTSSNLTLTDTSAIVTRFDTIAFDFISGSLAGDMLVTRANIALSSAATITGQPVPRGVTPGTNALFTTTAVGNPAPALQWQRKAAGSAVWSNLPESGPYSGTTTGALLVSGVTANMDGDQFRVVAGTGSFSATSDAAALVIVPPGAVGRITNLSVLTSIAAAPDDQFTIGYAIGGDGTIGAKPLVIRAVGPSLGALGVTGTLDDPKVEFFTGPVRSGGNDDWGGGSELATAMAGVGAFALAGPASKDAAAFASVSGGSNSVVVSANRSATGAVIAEIYDATPAATWGAATPRLINVSVLKPIGDGLTAGFTIGGGSPKPVLVRAIGPSLAAFGVSRVLVDPQLVLFDGAQTPIAQNDDWGGASALVSAFAQAGAFSISPTSKDAALIATLPPGGYTVRVTGVGGATGTALVEIYELP